eukprot:TRINITY_DN10485_c0_g1_i1.p1 TRINITY_DN10485_c0_g1~~TRINITY_DN10485_c0_g1_i1.p1  ORF type:complete len:596 (+),score=212.53 TRINITY_DN10485_c0_g1_i1:58-1788(+)
MQRVFSQIPSAARPQARSYGKNVQFGAEARTTILNGAQKLAKAVAVTLGPKGRNVVIANKFGNPKITKDGVTVAKSIEFSNPLENVGAQLVRSVASKTNDQAGDGTTTASVLTVAIYEEGMEKVAGGLNPMDLYRGIQKAVDVVVAELGNLTRAVDDNEQLRQVASVSANSDLEIGTLLADAINRVSKDGAITVEKGKTLETEVEVVEGLKFESGYLSPSFASDRKSQELDMKDALVLIVDHKIPSARAIHPILKQVYDQNKSLFIISSDGVESEVLTTLIINKLNGLKVCAVKAPDFGENRNAKLQDMAILTGAELISEDFGTKLEDVKIKHLGKAKEIKANPNSTIILGGEGAKEEIEERCDMIREKISSPNTGTYDKEKLQDRLGKLLGGVAVIKVGGASEFEVNEKKDRVDDALNATLAAIEGGIVPGGGTALLYASLALDNLKVDNFDQQVGVEILKKAIRMPVKQIAHNAGIDGAVVVAKLIDGETVNTSQGFNAQSLQYVDMFESGIIDPVKVVRTGLIDASSVAGLMITTETLVTEEPEPEGAAPAAGMGGGMPGMGGMGGMGGGMGF